MVCRLFSISEHLRVHYHDYTTLYAAPTITWFMVQNTLCTDVDWNYGFVCDILL